MTLPENQKREVLPPAGRAPQRAVPSPLGAQPGEAVASPAFAPQAFTSRNREEGRGLGGGDSSPNIKGNAAQQSIESSDAAISFDPMSWEGQGSPNNLPCPITVPGGEDWLTVNFHVDFESFEKLADQLDDAQLLQPKASKATMNCNSVTYGS